MGGAPAIIAPPAGKAEQERRASSTQVLRHLLSNRPNQVVTHADVCEALGYAITPQAVCNAARSLRSGPFGMPIVTHHGPGGGHILLVPVLTLGRERCLNCASRTPLGACRLTSRPRCPRLVDLNEWCKGWSQCQS